MSREFLDAVTKDFDYVLANNWWNRLLEDETAMNKWLAKLWKTEHGGYLDNHQAIANFKLTGRAENIFSRVADDEAKHAALLDDVLVGRGIKTTLQDQPNSDYWFHMYAHITDGGSCAAVFAVGEQLAALRFKLMAEHKKTPSDVMYFLHEALPDETYHAKAFASLAAPEQMKSAYEQHLIAVNILKNGK